MSGIESWSTTPANNNQAPPFGWPAGILPSQVEPIGRQMMTSLAAWYQAAEWINYNFTPTYIGATQFSLPGNATALYHVGRRVQGTDGSTSVFGTITVSAFTTLTTVTVVWDTGVLQTGVTIVYVGITSAVNTSAPALGASAFANPSGTVGLTAVNGTATTAMRSDAAPALSQAVSPTWSGTHTFSNPITVNGAGTSLKGGVSIVAPGSGVAFSATGIASQYAGLFTAGGAGGTQKGLSAVSTTQNAADKIFNVNNSISNLIDIFGDGHGDLGPNLSWTTGGAWTIGAPISGNAVVVNGASGAHSTRIADSATNVFDAGYLDIPQNLQTANYAPTLSDRGKGVDFNGTSLTCTIPANASVAFPIGTTILITNLNATSLSIVITTDTLTLAGTTTTGTRTLGQNGEATIRKVTSTSWLISGSGLS